jgi:opacity protein-like surface antigen
MRSPSITSKISLLLVAGAILASTAQLATGDEIGLKALQPLEAKKKKNSAYVGVFLGQSMSQEAEMEIDYVGRTLEYDVADRNNDLLVGFEVGYNWRTKYPFELGLEFEGFFGSTEINAIASSAPNAGLAIDPGDVATAQTDLNFAAFMINATLTLDLRKYRPRLGKWLPRFRPYVGGGIGGAQLWYRNQRIQTFGDLAGTPKAPSSSPFSIDEFVFVSQVFAGLEFRVNDKLGIYSEFRRLSFEKTNELSSLEMDILLGGLRLNY